MSSEHIHLPIGSVALRMRLFGSPEAELRDCMQPPWPRWMLRLYELERRRDPRVDPETGEIAAAAALSALKSRLGHRLELLSWICGRLELHGWEIQFAGEHLVASRVMVPERARETLDTAGVAGPLLAVCELDKDGWPRLYESWELARL
jgi:hypothetical protein